jgi:hypothetical protein
MVDIEFVRRKDNQTENRLEQNLWRREEKANVERPLKLVPGKKLLAAFYLAVSRIKWRAGSYQPIKSKRWCHY